MLSIIALQVAAGVSLAKIGACIGAGLAAIGAGIGIGKTELTRWMLLPVSRKRQTISGRI